MTWSLPKFVHVREDGPRDGFQNEPQFIPTDKKVEVINGLLDAGLRRVEVTSFVHPKWIPQLADGDEVLRQIDQRAEACYSVLLPNRRGLERAMASRAAGVKIDELVFVVSATERHNLANVNKSIDQSMHELAELIRDGKLAGFRIAGAVAVAFGCPFEGRVTPEQPIRLAKEMSRAGADEIILGDTIGAGNPAAVREIFARTKRELVGVEITAHFHNTRGQGMANVLAALIEGIDSFESAVGELGGCPYAPGATGNIPTEDLVWMLHEMGIETGIDLDRLVGCARRVQEIVGHELPSHVLRAGLFNWQGTALG